MDQNHKCKQRGASKHTMTEQVTYTWTGPPNIVWMQRPPLLLALCLFLLVYLLGSLSTLLILEQSGRHSPDKLTKEEKEVDFVLQKTFPIKMRLEIIAADQYNKDYPDTNAVSYPTISPCRILIPNNWEIEAVPSMKYAQWTNISNGNILAHEILHCLRGSWHSQ